MMKRRHRISGNEPGKWNRLKCKALLLLYLRAERLGNNKEAAIGLSEIHQLSGVNYNSLKASIGKWHRWGYLRRYRIKKRFYGYVIGEVYGYSITTKGVAWVEWARFYLPVSEYLAEIQRWQAERSE